VLLRLSNLLCSLPQLYKLFFSHSEHAVGLSLITWVLYALLALLWAIYGFVHKNPPIWVGNSLGFLMDAAMVFGIGLFYLNDLILTNSSH